MQQKIRRKTIIKKRISLFSPKKPQLPFTNIHLQKSSSKILYVSGLFFVTALTLQIYNVIIILKIQVRMIIVLVNIKKLDENAVIHILYTGEHIVLWNEHGRNMHFKPFIIEYSALTDEFYAKAEL